MLENDTINGPVDNFPSDCKKERHRLTIPSRASCADLAEVPIVLSTEESDQFEMLRTTGLARPIVPLNDHGIVIEE